MVPLIRAAITPSGLGKWAWQAASYATKSSSSRWLQRQKADRFTQEAKMRNYASRAAYKLKEMDKRYKLFRSGMTVVDLGFAPGSWTQVAVEETSPGGTVVGVDILHHPPPAGASVIQGNFLSTEVQNQVKELVARSKGGEDGGPVSIDVVLSDMMANTSGIAVKDHGASIDLCDAALLFAIECLKPNGSFVCKFYTGPEDKELEARLKKVFKKVKREKPEASRKESKEMYFVGLNKREGVKKEDIWDMF
ncbi:rRNA methyltransferase 2, mitochondrial [Trichomonascus vanleenenianus]|uniref:21S rRNA (uridine2791-2'-O) methyltransferase n=1 Tax=Trichomonascus vanleenenianus TaxID=2268995 RepID=UPI003ECA17A6